MVLIGYSIIKIAIAVLGLTIPGYALARVLRLERCWLAMFAFSVLIICQIVVWLAIIGGEISFNVVVTILVVFSVCCGYLIRRRPERDKETLTTIKQRFVEAPLIFKISVSLSVLLVLAVAFRMILYPLGGPDTFTRWDALARNMFHYGSLFYYPPVKPSDYSIYFVPDGFPPLVASAYWWIYASFGAPLPALTFISVVLQLISVLCLTYATVEKTLGENAACFTLMTLISSPLLINSFEIGQESGFLSVSLIGQLCFALAAIRHPSASTVIASALFASLGSLAREYGPILAVPGLLILLRDAGTKKFAVTYALLVTGLTLPWYVRNWFITGNPFYSHALPLGFPVNEVFVAMMKYYVDIFALSGFSLTQWSSLLYEIMAGAIIPIVVGILSMILYFRNLIPYFISIFIVFGIWFWSVGQTCGGVLYSLRVLSPAIVVLSCVSASIYAQYFDPLRNLQRQKLMATTLIIFACWGIISALSFPRAPKGIFSSILSTNPEIPVFSSAYLDLARQINTLNMPPTGILTESSYFAVILDRETKMRPVMIYNPEVSFLNNPNISGEEARRRLIGMNIRLVAISKSSIENDFLSRFSLYNRDSASWRLLLVAGDDAELYEFPAQSK